MTVSNKAVLSESYEIAIPDHICKGFNWRVGQEFVLIPKERGVLLMPIPTGDDLFGMSSGANTDEHRDRNDRV